jgi:hypothetical protein
LTYPWIQGSGFLLLQVLWSLGGTILLLSMVVVVGIMYIMDRI